MTRSELLHAAEVCVCGQREEDYGTPEDSFRVIGELWETYIKEKCVGDPEAEVCIVPEDVAALLALLKIARIATGHGKSDNWVDLYGLCRDVHRGCKDRQADMVHAGQGGRAPEEGVRKILRTVG